MRSKGIQTTLAGVLLIGVLGLSLPGTALAQANHKSKPKVHLILIKTKGTLYEYSPATITIQHGQKVTWWNKTHNDQTASGDNYKWTTPTIKPGKKASYTFKKKGKYPFHDNFATYIFGTVKVK